MGRLIQQARERRLLLWAGVAVFVAGAALDLAVHALFPAPPFPLIHVHAPAENLAHTLTFVGMVLLLAGVLVIPRRRPLGVTNAELVNESWPDVID